MALHKTDDSEPFYISDSPITMHNTINNKPYRGSLGYEVEGIEIYFPISKNYTLSFNCPSIYKMLKIGFQNYTNIRNYSKESLNNICDLIYAFENLETVSCSSENVIFYNSLQVASSEQYVFSSINNFELVKLMVDDNTRYKKGHRINIS